MPSAFKLILKPTSEGSLPGNQGPAVHGLFLKLINETDAPLAEMLHQGSEQHPFTLSPPYLSKGIPGDSIRRFSTNTEAAIRLCILDDSITQRIYNALLNAMKTPCVKLSGFDFSLSGLLIESALTFEQINKGAQDADSINKFKLDFRTPTAFKREGKSMLFPQADYILGGLEKRWNQYAEPIDKTFMREAVSGVYPSQYALKTSILELTRKKDKGCTDTPAENEDNIKTGSVRDKYYKSGFTGFCTYETDQLFKGANAILFKLLVFAGFAGIGYKTTMGMGQVKSEINV